MPEWHAIWREYIIWKGQRVPLKIKKLKSALAKAGFVERPAKGSHTFWYYPTAREINVTLSGKDGDDASPYQVKYVRQALKKVRREL